jgi:hypothetical protein
VLKRRVAEHGDPSRHGGPSPCLLSRCVYPTHQQPNLVSVAKYLNYTAGEMVWQGRADLVVGRCCIELKAINKPPSTAGRQLHDYITEKNKVVMLQNSMPSEFFNNGCTSAKELKTCEDLLYWGLVINFNPASGAVETFIPFRKKNAATSQQSKGVEEKVYMDTELLGCRVKMHDIRGMVDSITAGCSGEILFQVQFSDGRRCSMLRKDLEPILSDVDIAVSSDLKQKVFSLNLLPCSKQSLTTPAPRVPQNTISAFHSSVACFAKNRLRKTTDPAKFVTYKALVAAFEDFSSVKIDGGSMWFRNFMQKNFRVTYRKVDGTSREMVLFGGVGKGLLVTRG